MKNMIFFFKMDARNNRINFNDMTDLTNHSDLVIAFCDHKLRFIQHNLKSTIPGISMAQDLIQTIKLYNTLMELKNNKYRLNAEELVRMLMAEAEDNNEISDEVFHPGIIINGRYVADM